MKLKLIERFFVLILLLLVVLINGCTSNANRRNNNNQILRAISKVNDATFNKRAKELNTVLSKINYKAIVVDEIFLPEDSQELANVLIKDIINLGFNKVIINIGNINDFLEDRVNDFILYCKKYDLDVFLSIRQSNFVHEFERNEILRLFDGDDSYIPDMIEIIDDFNEDLPVDAKLSGIIFEIEPHKFVKGSYLLPKNYLYFWDEESYGIKLDNDMMLLDVLETFEKAKKTTNLPMILSVADFYHEKAKEGELSKGTIQDFLNISNKVIIRNSGNKASESLDVIEEELSLANRAKSVYVDFALAEHSSIDEGAFRRRNWADFIRSLSYLLDKWSQYPSFDGITIGPLRIIDQLQKEEE